DRIGAIRARSRVAADPDDAQVEGTGELRQAAADPAKADNQQRLAAEFVLALGPLTDHPAPEMSPLVVTGLGETANHRQDERHRMLGDGARVDAAGAGEADAAFLQQVARELIHPGADRLNKSEALPGCEKPVVPQP